MKDEDGEEEEGEEKGRKEWRGDGGKKKMIAQHILKSNDLGMAFIFEADHESIHRSIHCGSFWKQEGSELRGFGSEHDHRNE